MTDPFQADITDRMIELGRQEPKTIASLFMCLAAEAGELAEAVNAKLGFLPHKVMKEPLEGEVADVINTAISVLVKAYPGESTAQVKFRLIEQLHKKAAKWERAIEAAQAAQRPSNHQAAAERLRRWLGHPACPAESVQADLRAAIAALEQIQGDCA